jgi:hypothetical protein
LAQTDLGRNFGMVYGTGSDLTGNSRAALDASTSATTNTVGLRLVDFIRGPDSVVGDAYPDVLVKFNAPFFGQTTGI